MNLLVFESFLGLYFLSKLFTALAKLHSFHIAHCDLKPENILLVENTDFPHVKICDFGYSKIIGDKSMRRCLVGTTAYLRMIFEIKKAFKK
jgi:serine/threonine protein kinase